MGIVYKSSAEINPGVRHLPQVIKKNLKLHFTYSKTSYPKNNLWINLIDKSFLRFYHDQNPFPSQGETGGDSSSLFNGQALIFNGVDRSLMNPNSPGHGILDTNNTTINMWIKQSSDTNTNSGIFWISDSINKMLFLRYNSSTNTLYVSTEDKLINVRTNTNIVDKWTNISVTKSTSDIKVYINAREVTNLEQDDGYEGLWNIYTSYISIGSLIFEGSPQDYFNGEISIVSVYDRVLDADEIRVNYENLKGKYI